MARRFKLWDKKEDIWTIAKDAETGRAHYTAQEYIEMKAPWAGNPNIQVIVSAGPINGAEFTAFDTLKNMCVESGMEIPDGLTDDEVLELMEDWMTLNNIPEVTASPEERIAAAMEYQNLLTMEDNEIVSEEELPTEIPLEDETAGNQA